MVSKLKLSRFNSFSLSCTVLRFQCNNSPIQGHMSPPCAKQVFRSLMTAKTTECDDIEPNWNPSRWAGSPEPFICILHYKSKDMNWIGAPSPLICSLDFPSLLFCSIAHPRQQVVASSACECKDPPTQRPSRVKVIRTAAYACTGDGFWSLATYEIEVNDGISDLLLG